MRTYVSGRGAGRRDASEEGLGCLDFLDAKIAGGERKRHRRIRGLQRLRLFEFLRRLLRLVHRHQRLRERQPQLHVARSRERHRRQNADGLLGSPDCSCDDRQRLQRLAVLDRRRGGTLERVPRGLELARAVVQRAEDHPSLQQRRTKVAFGKSVARSFRRLSSASATVRFSAAKGSGVCADVRSPNSATMAQHSAPHGDGDARRPSYRRSASSHSGPWRCRRRSAPAAPCRRTVRDAVEPRLSVRSAPAKCRRPAASRTRSDRSPRLGASAASDSSSRPSSAASAPSELCARAFVGLIASADSNAARACARRPAISSTVPSSPESWR